MAKLFQSEIAFLLRNKKSDVMMALLFQCIILSGCFNVREERINDENISNDLCDFDQGVIVAIVFKSESHKRLECLINGVGHNSRISNTLYTYIDEMYEPGDTVKCSYDESHNKKRQSKQMDERETRVPIME